MEYVLDIKDVWPQFYCLLCHGFSHEYENLQSHVEGIGHRWRYVASNTVDFFVCKQNVHVHMMLYVTMTTAIIGEAYAN